MKKIICVVLALIMVFGLAVNVFADPTGPTLDSILGADLLTPDEIAEEGKTPIWTNGKYALCNCGNQLSVFDMKEEVVNSCMPLSTNAEVNGSTYTYTWSGFTVVVNKPNRTIKSIKVETDQPIDGTYTRQPSFFQVLLKVLASIIGLKLVVRFITKIF